MTVAIFNPNELQLEEIHRRNELSYWSNPAPRDVGMIAIFPTAAILPGGERIADMERCLALVRDFETAESQAYLLMDDAGGDVTIQQI